MPWFPMFVQLKGADALLVGGGTVALRKAEKLLPYGPRITVVAPDIIPELAVLPGLTLCRRPFEESDLQGTLALVIAATDDTALNRKIAALCREKRIPVNVVDDPEACGFLFPALVRRGRLSVGISTGGASPTAAVWLKERIESILPPHFGAALDRLEALRPALKARLPGSALHLSGNWRCPPDPLPNAPQAMWRWWGRAAAVPTSSRCGGCGCCGIVLPWCMTTSSTPVCWTNCLRRPQPSIWASAAGTMPPLRKKSTQNSLNWPRRATGWCG